MFNLDCKKVKQKHMHSSFPSLVQKRFTFARQRHPYRSHSPVGPRVPVYCFDPRQYEETELELPRTGPHRAQFLLETSG